VVQKGVVIIIIGVVVVIIIIGSANHDEVMGVG